MTTDEILRELRAQHAQKLSERNRLEADLTKLANSIAALAGDPPAPKVSEPTVPELVLLCFQEFQKRHPSNGLGLVMTNENVMEQARLMFKDNPARITKIKQGLCNAKLALIKKGKLKQSPGGWELT